jgi:beta-glucosidase
MRRRAFLAGSALASLSDPARLLAAPAARFPADFAWGVATSAFQIEGGLDRDGRGPSVWDDVARRNPAYTGPAVDHYDRWREDVALLARLGVKAYRFSVAWPRVLPQGDGKVNAPGLDFYDRLVDRLLAAGITPVPCLYHWDLPAALQARGGWLDRSLVEIFARYAEIVAARLGDRARDWIAVNEALSIAYGGYANGVYPPFLKDPAAYFRAAHHLNLAQGAALATLRAPGRRLGTAMALYPVHPATASAADAAAASFHAAMTTKLFLDPLLLGRYPDPVANRVEPSVRPGDLTSIRQKVDFVGVNYYTPQYRRAAPERPFGTAGAAHPGPRTGNGWLIAPRGLYEQLTELRERYRNPPVWVTENGAAYPDRRDDAARIAYLHAHLLSARRALADGARLRGYFVWSLLDNYEWLVGFGSRFGLVYVDTATGARTPKQSFFWYRGVIRSGSV